MRWLMRINGMLSANVHDFLDRCENPDQQLGQAVREMESALQRTVNRAVQALAEERLLAKRAEEFGQRIQAWTKRARLAVERGDDVGARSALQTKLECQRTLDNLLPQVAQLRETNEQLRNRICEMREHVRIAKAKRATLSARYTAAHAKREAVKHSARVDAADDAFQTFRRMAERIERSEAEADALAELSEDRLLTDDPIPCDEVAIEAELAALKSNVSP